jgi:hypothetical protein
MRCSKRVLLVLSMAQTLVHPPPELESARTPAPGLRAVRGRVVLYSERTGVGVVESATRRVSFKAASLPPGAVVQVGDRVEAHVNDRNFAVEEFLLAQ